MSNQAELNELCALVETSFRNAIAQTDHKKRYDQLRDCSRFAGVASCSMGANGDLYRAACLEGVAVEARRLGDEMMPRGMTA